MIYRREHKILGLSKQLEKVSIDCIPFHLPEIQLLFKAIYYILT